MRASERRLACPVVHGSQISLFNYDVRFRAGDDIGVVRGRAPPAFLSAMNDEREDGRAEPGG